MSFITEIILPTIKLSSGKNFGIKITLTNTGTGTNSAIYARDHRISLLELGELKVEYDYDDLLLIPAEINMTLGDLDEVLKNIFFGNSAVNLAYEKNAEVKISVNTVETFVGNIVLETIRYSNSKKELSFEVMPELDILSATPLYDDTEDTDGNPDNNLYYNALNPLNYTQGRTKSTADILVDLFQLVNPNFSSSGLTVVQDWTFKGRRDSNICFLNNITFSEIHQGVDTLFFNNSKGLSNCRDLLQKIAIDYGCIAGMPTKSKAFFIKLFHYSTDNLQEVTVLDHTFGYKMPTVDYVKCSSQSSDPTEPYKLGLYTEVSGKFIERNSLPGFFVDETETVEASSNTYANVERTNHYLFITSTDLSELVEGDIYSNNGSQFQVVGTKWELSDAHMKVATERILGTNEPETSGILTQVSGTGYASITYTSVEDNVNSDIGSNVKYEIYKVRSTDINDNEFMNFAELSANFWYNNRNPISKSRIDKFKLLGVEYDFLKNFNYGGSKYQIVSLRTNYLDNTTICEAIYMGEVE